MTRFHRSSEISFIRAKHSTVDCSALCRKEGMGHKRASGDRAGTSLDIFELVIISN